MILGFFEALFGSAYIGGRLLGESLSDAASKARDAEFEEASSHVKNLELELQLLREPVSGFSGRRATEKMAELIPTEDIVYVFGNEYKDIFKNFIATPSTIRDENIYHGFYDINSVLFNILYSQKGYITDNRVIYGYWCGYPVNGLPHEMRVQTQTRACEIIDRNIRREHPELDIYLCECADPQQPKDAPRMWYRWNIWLNVSNQHTEPFFIQNHCM